MNSSGAAGSRQLITDALPLNSNSRLTPIDVFSAIVADFHHTSAGIGEASSNLDAMRFPWLYSPTPFAAISLVRAR
jgi:hypothetical protein